MKNKDLYAFINRLDQLKDLAGVKFSYGLIKNKKTFINEVQILEETKKVSEKFIEYDNKRMGIAKKYSKKNEKGNPDIVNNGVVIEETKIEEANKEFKKLENEYKKEIEEHTKKLDEFNKLVEKEISVDVHYIDYEDLPKNITPEQLDIVFDLIKDKK